MDFKELEPYLAAISAALNVATLGFLLNVIKTVRDNAQDRIAVQDERLKRAAEEQARTEKWAEREKSDLREQLNKIKAEMDSLLKREGLDLNTLALGRQLSASSTELRTTAQALVDDMKNKLAQLTSLEPSRPDSADPDWELSIAMGAMASGSYKEAAAHFDAYARDHVESWEVHYSRGVAHANSRRGRESNLASLRAYNEALALAPSDVDANVRARMFSYRGAVLKRLGRLQEAEADIRISLSFATAEYESLDAHYNLACIHAIRGEREPMIEEIRKLDGNQVYLGAIASHMRSYFARFQDDAEFRALLQGVMH